MNDNMKDEQQIYIAQRKTIDVRIAKLQVSLTRKANDNASCDFADCVSHVCQKLDELINHIEGEAN